MKKQISTKSLLAFLLLLGVIGTAGCDTSASCKNGTANCGCATNGTCNAGLSCVSNRCMPVDAPVADALGSVDQDNPPDSESATKADAPADNASIEPASDAPISSGGGGEDGGLMALGTGGAGGGATTGGGGAGGSGTSVGLDSGSSGDAPLATGTTRLLDLVFVIDNSPSMAPKQEKLKAQFPKLIAALRAPTTNTLPDLRVAIVDTDLGSGGAYPSGSCGPNTNNGDSPLGDQGKFRMINASTCGVSDPSALWLEYTNGSPVNFIGDINTVFTCLAGGVGTLGCGLEHPIQALELALAAKGLGNEAQQAMLRPEAYLGLVLLTDEDDCSAATNDGMFGDKPELKGESASLRCATRAHACGGMNLTGPPPEPGYPTTTAFEAPFASCMARTDACSNAIDGDQGTDTSVPTMCSPLRDFKHVADGIKKLKTDPSRQILVAGIFGWPVGGNMANAQPYKIAPIPNPNTADTAHPSVFDYWPVCYDPDHLPTHPDLTTGFDTDAAGWGATGGVRMSAFIDEFGANGMKFSICEKDFGTVMKEIGDKVAGTLIGSGGAGGASGSGGTGGTGGTGGRVVDASPSASGGSGGSSTATDCGLLSNPANGSVYAPYSTAGSTASYACLAGYSLSGPSLRICQASGAWTGTTPTCVSTGCAALSDPAGGTVSAPLRSVGSQASYACRAGYTMVGVPTRTCQPDGTWSGTAPTCVAVDCGLPGAPGNGNVSVPTTTYSSTATFSCMSGFTLSGTATITCQSNGTWSGTVPSCVCNKTNCKGACVDTQTDANHCGGCDTVCTATPPSTVECSSGRCLTTLALTDMALGLAVNDTSVYWSTTSGKIMTVPLAGGSATTLATGQNQPEDIAVGTDGVYWVNYFGATVMKMPLSGGDAIAIASGQGSPSGIAVDASSVYWANGSIMKTSHDGGTVTPVVSGTGVSAWSLAVSSANVYWIGSGTVMTAPLSGGTFSTLSSGLARANDIAIDGTNAYAASSGTSANSYTDGTVTKVPLGGGATIILAKDQASPNSVAADGTSVYWGNSAAAGSGGALMKVSVDGTGTTTLVPARAYPVGVAVDATSVYWSDGGKNGSGYVVLKLTPK